MSWIQDESGNTPLEALLAHRPPLLEGYRKFYAALWQEGLVSARVLEICRLRIAAIHDCAAEWHIRDSGVQLGDDEVDAILRGEAGCFDEGERAALSAAERIPYQHHEMTDDEVAALKQAFGDGGCVSLLNALVLFDANCRLKLVFDVDSPQISVDRRAGVSLA